MSTSGWRLHTWKNWLLWQRYIHTSQRLISPCPHAPPPQGCSGSICEKYGLEACTCASQDGKDETELCHVCCMEKSESFTFLFHLHKFILFLIFTWIVFFYLNCVWLSVIHPRPQWIPTRAAAQDRSAWLVSSIRKWPRCQQARRAMTSRVTATCSWSAAWWMQTDRWPGWRRPSSTQSSTRTSQSGLWYVSASSYWLDYRKLLWGVSVLDLCFILLLQAHWWAVLLMGIALIMLMAGFIKICSVHTPSSNPKLPPPKPLPGESRYLQTPEEM